MRLVFIILKVKVDLVCLRGGGGGGHNWGKFLLIFFMFQNSLEGSYFWGDGVMEKFMKMINFLFNPSLCIAIKYKIAGKRSCHLSRALITKNTRDNTQCS